MATLTQSVISFLSLLARSNENRNYEKSTLNFQVTSEGIATNTITLPGGLDSSTGTLFIFNSQSSAIPSQFGNIKSIDVSIFMRNVGSNVWQRVIIQAPDSLQQYVLTPRTVPDQAGETVPGTGCINARLPITTNGQTLNIFVEAFGAAMTTSVNLNVNNFEVNDSFLSTN